MPIFGKLEAVHQVERALGRKLPAKAEARLRRDPVFASFREGVAQVDECVEVVQAWGRDRQVADLVPDSAQGWTDAEREFLRARSVVAHEMANADPSVIDFRTRVLPEGLPADIEAAERWIKSRWKREGPPYEMPALDYVGTDGAVNSRAIKRGGELDQLRGLSERLASAHGWQPAQATAFVLTDGIPLVPVLTLTTSGDSQPDVITIRASVEMSAESVARAFAQAREGLSGGRRFRALPAHVWRAVSFVGVREARTWGALRSEWNRDSDGPHYGTDRAFAKAVRSGLSRLKLEWSTDET